VRGTRGEYEVNARLACEEQVENMIFARSVADEREVMVTGLFGGPLVNWCFYVIYTISNRRRAREERKATLKQRNI